MDKASKPILFLLGPSESKKTQLASWVAEDLGFVHIEIDRWPEGDGIDLSPLEVWPTRTESIVMTLDT
jgi:hypothetical protein